MSDRKSSNSIRLVLLSIAIVVPLACDKQDDQTATTQPSGGTVLGAHAAGGGASNSVSDSEATAEGTSHGGFGSTGEAHGGGAGE